MTYVVISKPNIEISLVQAETSFLAHECILYYLYLISYYWTKFCILYDEYFLNNLGSGVNPLTTSLGSMMSPPGQTTLAGNQTFLIIKGI